MSLDKRLALAYVVLGLVVAVAGGMLIDRMGLEGEVPAFVREGREPAFNNPAHHTRDPFLTSPAIPFHPHPCMQSTTW